MADAGLERYRDMLRRLVPWWLSDRRLSTGENVGYRFLWSVVASLDVLAEAALQALRAPWPGIGTPTALPLIGASRGIARGQADTDAVYASRLALWLDKWAHAGSARQLATQLHEYLGNAPRVRVITRSGVWVTVAADGTITTTNAAWNWDSVSNPERSGYWSEIWIVVYPTEWANSGNWGDGRLWGARDSGIGHVVTRPEVDAVKAIIAQWKAAHTRVRCVIWTSDSTLFDPATPASCPDGNWGEYGKLVSGSMVPARNTTTCRYWEP